MDERIRSINQDPEFSSLRKKLEGFDFKAGPTEIEEPIYDTVAVLNLLGLETANSCGGHDLNDTKEDTPERFLKSIAVTPFVSFAYKDGSGADKHKALSALLEEFYTDRKIADPKAAIVISSLESEGDYVHFNLASKISTTRLSEQLNKNDEIDLNLLNNWDELQKKQQQYIDKNMNIFRKEFEDFAKFLYKKHIAGYRL